MVRGINATAVEMKPEIVFLFEVLQEVARDEIRIPRFQRAFVWRPDQMTDLLDSIYNQYPIGSLLVWETSTAIDTLEHLGPFSPQSSQDKASAGYLLDGHQRLLTLASALLPGDDNLRREDGLEGGKWEMYWNVERRRFQHRMPRSKDLLFPMTALLDTMRFFDAMEEIRDLGGPNSKQYVNEISALARTFQSYRVPIIRIKQTGLSEAVEIFARLNSRGQSMSADQMVSALTFRQDASGNSFDLASELDRMILVLGESFGEIDRSTLLRAILANLDEDIYKTDWTKLAGDSRDDLQSRLKNAVSRTEKSMQLAINFLRELGVATGRLLPYGLQLVLLSAFFDRQSNPSRSQLVVLRRWFWVSSFSAWFGGANPSRTSALITEFREMVAGNSEVTDLVNFDLAAESLPYPSNFDMRSARTRALLLVMLMRIRSEANDGFVEFAIEELSAKGPSAVGSIYWSPPREMRGNPANRLFRGPSAPRGALRPWIINCWETGDWAALSAAAVDEQAYRLMLNGDSSGFLRRRQATLTKWEVKFQIDQGVTPSRLLSAEAPIDTD